MAAPTTWAGRRRPPPSRRRRRSGLLIAAAGLLLALAAPAAAAATPEPGSQPLPYFDPYYVPDPGPPPTPEPGSQPLPWFDPYYVPDVTPASPSAPAPAVDDFDTVLENLRNWLVGILAAVATLFFTVGGLRYAAAGGDPGEVDAAKRCFRNAAVGYALAVLAPLFLAALRSVVGA